MFDLLLISPHLKIEKWRWNLNIYDKKCKFNAAVKSLVNWFGKSAIHMQVYLRASNTTSGEIFDFQGVRFFRKCSGRDRTSEYTAMHANRAGFEISTSTELPDNGDRRVKWRIFEDRDALMPELTSPWIGGRRRIATRISEHAFDTLPLPIPRLVVLTRTSSGRSFDRDGNMTKWFHLWKIHKLMSEMLQSDIYCQLYRGQRFSRDIEIQNENAKVYRLEKHKRIRVADRKNLPLESYTNVPHTIDNNMFSITSIWMERSSGREHSWRIDTIEQQDLSSPKAMLMRQSKSISSVNDKRKKEDGEDEWMKTKRNESVYKNVEKKTENIATKMTEKARLRTRLWSNKSYSMNRIAGAARSSLLRLN